MATRDE